MLKTSASVKPGPAEVKCDIMDANSKEHSKPTAVTSNREESAN